MSKVYKKIAIFMVVILWMVYAIPVQASQMDDIEEIVESYMDARFEVLLYGEAAQLSQCAVGGIVSDEKLHYDKILENGINVLSSSYEIISINESDIIVELVVEERLLYKYGNAMEEEFIEHNIGLMYDEEGELLVVSDGYIVDCSEFISASYVSEIVPYVVGSGSGNCVVTVAKSQIGYYEKETNSNLESFTANAGNKNYTKYGAWTGNVVKQRTMSWSNTSLIGFAHPAYASSTHSWVAQSGYYQCLICGQTASTIPIAPASFSYE